MKLKMRVVGLSLLALNMSSCGVFGGSSGGGSGGGSPSQNPTTDATSTPSTEEVDNTPLTVVSIEDLIKKVGATGFTPTAMTDSDWYTRMQEVEDLSKRDSLPSVFSNINVTNNQSGVPASCSIGSSMGIFRLFSRVSFFGLEYKFINGFEEYSQESDSEKHTVAKLAEVPSYATMAYLDNRSDEQDQTKRNSNVYLGATGDQILEVISNSDYKKDKLDQLINCVRFYTKSTKSLKTTCSWSTRIMGYTTQFNSSIEESFVENQFAMKDSYTLFKIKYPTQALTSILEIKQISADSASFDMQDSDLLSKPNKQSHESGVFQLRGKDGDRYKSCGIVSAEKK